MRGEYEFCWVLSNDGHQLMLPKHKPSSKRRMCWSIPAEWNVIECENVFAAISSGIMIARTSTMWDDQAYKVLRRELGG